MIDRPVSLALAIAGAMLWAPLAFGLDLPPLRAPGPPAFTADLLISLDADGRPSLGVNISLAYRELQWVELKTEGSRPRYGARVDLTVVFEPIRGGELKGDLWERRLVVPTFSMTRSPRAALVERRTFQVPPGPYRCRVIVRDLGAGTESVAEQRVEVPDYSKIPVGFADLELGVADSSSQFRPVPTRLFGLEVRQLAARAVLFDRRPGNWPRRYRFRCRITDETGEELVAGPVEVTINRSAEPVIVRPPSSDLFLGNYVFELELVERSSRWRVSRSFEVEESGSPRGREFERMLEPLAYIARPEEIDRLRNLPPERQDEGWQEFWKRRDPTPDTPRNEALVEFIRRVRHAERTFQGFGPGWRSDMGRIYIKYGPADQVESRPASSSTPQLEIWYYSNPYRRFVFGDREGFGRFVLLDPALE